MARLYEKPKARGVAPATAPQNNVQDYFEKIAKLIPSEIIAAYLTIVGLLTDMQQEQARLITLAVVFGLGVIGTPLYLKSLAQPGQNVRNHLIVSTIAFVIWAYSISGHLVPEVYNSRIASIVLIIFTVVSGRIRI